jgi:hypothetical protein
MHHYKHKRELNKKTLKKNADVYANDPSVAKCPYCGKSKRPCSHIDSLSRAWAREICKKQQGR